NAKRCRTGRREEIDDMGRRRRWKGSVSAGIDAWQTSLAAATTIAARTPIIMTAALTGSPKAVRETRRMVTEKAAAAVEGAIAAGGGWTSLGPRGAGGGRRRGRIGKGMPAGAAAAAAPGRRKCRANARRLTRGGRKRR